MRRGEGGREVRPLSCQCWERERPAERAASQLIPARQLTGWWPAGLAPQ